MRRVVGLILVLGVLPLAAASRQAAPQAVPAFKAGVDLIVLDVSALDDKRQPVRGLSAEDFTILEDGKPQAMYLSRNARIGPAGDADDDAGVRPRRLGDHSSAGLPGRRPAARAGHRCDQRD
jgi:hypothetical protein